MLGQNYRTVFHVDNAVGVAGKAFVVGDDYKRLLQLIAQAEKQSVKLLLVLRVEASRWLIGKNHSGLVDEGTRHCCTLAFATRQLRRLVFGTLA